VILVVVASLMMVGAYVVWRPFRVPSLRRRAALIKPGDDKNHVRSVLGRPADTYGGPECWAYPCTRGIGTGPRAISLGCVTEVQFFSRHQ